MTEMSAPSEVSLSEKVCRLVFKEENRSRIALIGVSLSLTLLSVLLICLMPGVRVDDKSGEELIERRIVTVISISLLAICPVAVVGVCIKHPSVNNAVVMFGAGVGSGCVCAISFSMIALNIVLAFIDIIRGKFRLNFVEMIAINVLMTALTLITYFQTSLSREVYLLYLEIEKNNANSVAQSGAQMEAIPGETNGKPTKSSKTTGSYDLNSGYSGSYNFY